MDEVLGAWGPVRVVGRLGGGNRNEVVEVRRGQQRLVARRSRRSAASLSWEVRLLEHPARHGVRVPQVVPALDGRRHVNRVLVMEWLEGRLKGTCAEDFQSDRSSCRPEPMTAASLCEDLRGWCRSPSRY